MVWPLLSLMREARENDWSAIFLSMGCWVDVSQGDVRDRNRIARSKSRTYRNQRHEPLAASRSIEASSRLDRMKVSPIARASRRGLRPVMLILIRRRTRREHRQRNTLTCIGKNLKYFPEPPPLGLLHMHIISGELAAPRLDLKFLNHWTLAFVQGLRYRRS